MNIVIFTDTFLPKIDGVAISVGNFTKLLSARGHKFLICCPHYNGAVDDPNQENVEIVRFKSAPLPSYPDIKIVLPSRRKIRKAMKEFKPDLVHIQTPGLLGQYGMIASKMYDIPMIGTYHTLVSEQHTYLSFYRLLKVDRLLSYFWSQKNIKNRLNKIERKKEKGLKKKVILKLTNRIYEAGKLIISPSYLIKKELESYGIRKPVYVVSNGMDLDKFAGKRKSAPKKSPRLLHVGRISYEKNCQVILRAFALIREKIPDATMDIIGDGPALASLKIEAKHLGLNEVVSFPGFVPYNSLPEVYPKYDLFITASTMETQGLVVLEATASGLPCVGVDSYALPELIQDGRNGYITEPFDHKAIAEKTIEIIENPDLYEKFSGESLAIASEHDIHACADRMETIYRMVVSDSHLPD